MAVNFWEIWPSRSDHLGLAGYISTNIFKALHIPYAGFLDKNTDLNNTEISVTKALSEYRYATNFIKTKLPDISHYFVLKKRGKNNLHKEIRQKYAQGVWRDKGVVW